MLGLNEKFGTRGYFIAIKEAGSVSFIFQRGNTIARIDKISETELRSKLNELALGEAEQKKSVIVKKDFKVQRFDGVVKLTLISSKVNCMVTTGDFAYLLLGCFNAPSFSSRLDVVIY